MIPVDPDNQNDVTPRRGLDFGATGSQPRGLKNVPPGNGAIRIRLAMLMVMLILVVVAMKEAGKPERWAWMGFGKPTIETDQIIRLKQFAPTSGSEEADQAMALRLTPTTPQSGSTSEKANGNDARFDLNVLPLPSSGRQLTETDRKFWAAISSDLGDGKRKQLFQIIRAICRSSGAGEASSQEDQEVQPADSSDADLIKELDARHDAWHQQMVTAGSKQREGNEKAEAIGELFEFDQRWQEMIEPTLRQSVAGEDILFAGQLYSQSLYNLLQPTWMEGVQDRTAMGDPADRMAWLWLWDQSMLDASNNSSAVSEPVSLLQLSGQPAVWRARPVRMEGVAKTVRRIEQTQTALPTKTYYEVWVEPTNSVHGNLCCLYTAHVPDSLVPPEESQHSARQNKTNRTHRSPFHSVDQPVSVSGRFFKLRSYRDAGGSVSHAPVVISHSIATPGTATAGATAAGRDGNDNRNGNDNKTIASQAWLFGAVAIASTIAAILLFRIARTRPRPVGRRASQHVRSTLLQLQDDQSLPSNALSWGAIEPEESEDLPEEKTS